MTPLSVGLSNGLPVGISKREFDRTRPIDIGNFVFNDPEPSESKMIDHCKLASNFSWMLQHCKVVDWNEKYQNLKKQHENDENLDRLYEHLIFFKKQLEQGNFKYNTHQQENLQLALHKAAVRARTSIAVAKEEIASSAKMQEIIKQYVPIADDETTITLKIESLVEKCRKLEIWLDTNVFS